MSHGEVPFMKSLNFEFLRAKRPVLADLGGFAEQYAHSDPQASLTKQRALIENIVVAVYAAYRLQPPLSDNLNDLMGAEPFRQSVPEVVQNKLHIVRKAGNAAVHQRHPIASQQALDCLYELFDAARWFYLKVDGGKRDDTPTYTRPEPSGATNGKAKEALEKLRLAEAKYESMLTALEEETKKRLEAERAAAVHATELTPLKEDGQKVATFLQFNEETTRRRLIDQALLAAGWNVGEAGKNTDQVKQELPLSGLRS